MLTIGDKIKLYREQIDITQDELAEKLNTSPQNVYKYEKGIITNIPLSTIAEMAELFGVSIARLLDWPDPDYVFNISNLDVQPLKVFLGNNIKRRREELNITYMDLAKKLKIVPEIISDYENGLFSNISISFLKELSGYLDTTPEELLNFSVLTDSFILDEKEKEIITVYRTDPVQRKIVTTLLNKEILERKASKNNSYGIFPHSEHNGLNQTVRIAKRKPEYAGNNNNPSINESMLKKFSTPLSKKNSTES